jgi:hypothetical protein
MYSAYAAGQMRAFALSLNVRPTGALRLSLEYLLRIPAYCACKMTSRRDTRKTFWRILSAFWGRERMRCCAFGFILTH